MMTPIASFDETTLRAICDVLGDTSSGLTGGEIGHVLSDCGIDDPLPNITKRRRLFEALRQRQNRDRCGNQVVAFIYAAMNPVRYVSNLDVFEIRRAALNQVLGFAGLNLGENGQLRQTSATRTISEARERASRLRRALLDRRVHPDVLRFCREELLQDNYFHAVFEATKSVADKIRERSGLGSDGSRLVDEAFGGQSPLLAFNTLQTATERSEHTGLINLLKGLFGTFRNTTAHAPKVKWAINEQDALDLLSLASLLHRRLDWAVRTRPTTPEKEFTVDSES
jgi:uncharacterized protein (TIGR02391 family)